MVQLEKLLGKEKKYILHGISMGGSGVLFALGKKTIAKKAHNISLVINDSGFDILKKELYYQHTIILGNSFHFKILLKFVLFGMSIINLFINNFLFSQYSIIKILQKRKKLATKNIPIIVFHGEKDSLVLPEVALNIKNADSCNLVDLHIIKDAPHIGSYFYEPIQYINIIKKYL